MARPRVSRGLTTREQRCLVGGGPEIHWSLPSSSVRNTGRSANIANLRDGAAAGPSRVGTARAVVAFMDTVRRS
jgi:hypothetical protein